MASDHPIVVGKLADFRWAGADARADSGTHSHVMTAEAFISESSEAGTDAGRRGRKVINLCRNHDYQKVANLGVASYTDHPLTVTKDPGSGFSVAAAPAGTDADKSFHVPAASAGSAKFMGKAAPVVNGKATF